MRKLENGILIDLEGKEPPEFYRQADYGIIEIQSRARQILEKHEGEK